MCWGIGAFLGKTVLKDASSIFTYLLESFGTLSIALLVGIFYREEVMSVVQNFSWAGYLFGILWGIGTVTFIFALKYGSASTVTPVTALYPLVTVLLAVIFLKETITLKIGVGILMAIGSMFLLL